MAVNNQYPLLNLSYLISEDEFDVTKFYCDIMDEEDGTQLPDPAERFDELMARVRMKEYKKRAVASVPFDMGQGMKIRVIHYSIKSFFFFYILSVFPGTFNFDVTRYIACKNIYGGLSFV